MTSVTHLMPFYDVPGKAAFSGAENHLFALMEGQAKAGLDVELVMVIGLEGERLKAKAQELRGKGIAVVEVTYPALGLGTLNRFLRPLIVPRLMKILRARRTRLVHIHPITASGSLIALAAALVGCRYVVVSYHNNEPYLLKFPFKQGLLAIDRLAKRTIAISGAVLSHLTEGVGLSAKRTKLVYYGVEIPQEMPDKISLRARLGVPADKFLVGLVGRLTEQKDIPTFLKALQKSPQIHGVIIGGGELEGELKALALELNLTNVTFTGTQPDGATLIGCLDVMVLPSKFEGLGLVLLEAMVRHVPIIGSRGGAIPEILENGELGRMFDVGDVAAFVAALDEFRLNPGLCRSYADKAFARAQEKFTIAAMVRNTSQLYDEVLAA